MPYVTTWERRAEMKGREEGVVLGKREWRSYFMVFLSSSACLRYF